MLIIGPTEAKAIRTAIEGALQNPIPWEALRPIADDTGRPHLPLDQRLPGVKAARRKYPPQRVMLGTYRANLSFELQPAGMFRHLSVSSVLIGMILKIIRSL